VANGARSTCLPSLARFAGRVFGPAGRVGGVRRFCGGGAEGGCARVRARSRERAPARAHPRPRPRPRAYSFTGGDCVAALPWLALALLQPGRIYRVRVSCAGEGKGGGGKEFGPPLRNSPFALLSPRRRDREVTRQPGGGAGQASRLKMVTEGRALF